MDFKQLKDIIIDTCGSVDPDEVTEDAAFSDLGLDSLDLAQIIFAVENELQIDIDPDILEEIQGRYVDKLELMNRELTKKKDEYTKLDDLVKQQRIYISSNYEAYIGKEFVDKEKLAELCNIMKSGACTTIAQAIAEYKNQH